MGEALLTFDEIVDLIRTPKPPLACRVVELTDGDEVRSARVIFDGIAGWLIETDEGTEFRHADDFVLFDKEGTLRRLGPGLSAHSTGWVKTPIEGRRMSLDQASGRVLGLGVVDGRRSMRAEFRGLRAAEDAVFEFDVDLETGIVLRMSRTDLGLVMRLEDLRIGSIEEAP
ncbi:MAG: hypothetical protein ACXWYE_06740 [Actinomycetota bacterium]